MPVSVPVGAYDFEYLGDAVRPRLHFSGAVHLQVPALAQDVFSFAVC